MDKGNWGGCGRRAVYIVTVLLFTSIALQAQQTAGRILGTVLDPSGSAVPNVQITITNQSTGAVRNVVTAADGVYNAPEIPAGHYTIEANSTGFSSVVVKDVTVTVGSDSRIDLKLQVGTVAQTVTVTEAVPLVNTTNSTVGSTVDEQRVADLPLNGRNWSDLTLMQPGVSQVQNSGLGGGNNALPHIAGLNGTIISVNGAQLRSNLYTLDGANMINLEGFNNASASGTSLGVDGILEYKVVTNTPSAEYGLVMGSQTTLVSKSGTNQFHGDAFDYLRNNSLDARNYFDTLDTLNVNGFGTDKSAIYPGKRLPPFRRNDFGGAFGGPIKKDKTFFYGVYEGIRQQLGVSTVNETLPAACFVNASGVVQSQVPAQIKNVNSLGTCAAASTITATNPGYNAATGIITLDYRMLPFADLYPSPNVEGVPSYNFALRFLQPTTENYGQMRVDHTFSAADSFFARYTQDDADELTDPADPGFYLPLLSQSYLVTLAENHVLSPTLLNSFRFSYSRTIDTDFPIANPSSLANGGTIITATQSVPQYTAFSGASSEGDSNVYSLFAQDIYTWSDDVFWTKGNHAFKFGTLMNHFLQYAQQNTPAGEFGYSNLIDFLTNPNNYNSLQIVGPNLLNPSQFSILSMQFRMNSFGFYAQDDYRMTSRLTLNMGLRYEFDTVPHERNPAIAYSLRNPLTDTSTTPGTMFLNNSLHDFSPRLGFAWDVTGKGTTSVRGGAGIYYDLTGYGPFEANLSHGDPPISNTYLWSNANSSSAPFFFTKYCASAATCPPAPAAGAANPLGTSNSFPFSPPLGQVQYVRTAQYHLQQPTLLQYNLQVQQQLPWNMALSVGFVGSRGWHLYQIREGNPTESVAQDANGLPIYGCWNTADTAHQLVAANGACPTGFTTSGPRLNPAWSSVAEEQAGADSYYDGLQVQVLKQITQGLQFQLNYTWSKSIDDGGVGLSDSEGTYGQVVDYLVPQRVDRAVSNTDITNNLRANMIYHAPNTKLEGIGTKFLNGWWFSSIISAQGGLPFSVSLSGDRELINSKEVTERPSYDPSFNPATVITGTAAHWFNPTMFDVPAAGHLGNVGRNTLRGPGITDVDFSAVKDTKAGFLGEAGMVEFRAEVFNILNHTNLFEPSGVVASPSATTLAGEVGTVITPPSTSGAITNTATSSRQIQLALKMIF